MNREQAKELLPIIQAIANGESEEIEEQFKDHDWREFDGKLMIDDQYRYRTKPKPREGWVNPNRIHDHQGGLCERDDCIHVREVL